MELMNTITTKEIVTKLQVYNAKISLALADVPRVAQVSNTYLYDRDAAREAVNRYFSAHAERYRAMAAECEALAEQALTL